MDWCWLVVDRELFEASWFSYLDVQIYFINENSEGNIFPNLIQLTQESIKLIFKISFLHLCPCLDMGPIAILQLELYF